MATILMLLSTDICLACYANFQSDWCYNSSPCACPNLFLLNLVFVELSSAVSLFTGSELVDLDSTLESLAVHIKMTQPLQDMFEESTYAVSLQEHLVLAHVEYKWNRLE